jgi:uncharacterized membrane protein
MAPLMTILSPLSLLATIFVLIASYPSHPTLFYFTFLGFIFFLIALIVTITIEVPIVKQIVSWADTSLPTNWQQLRDRWLKFHLVRVIAGIVGLISFLVGVALGL